MQSTNISSGPGTVEMGLSLLLLDFWLESNESFVQSTINRFSTYGLVRPFLVWKFHSIEREVLLFHVLYCQIHLQG